MRNDLPIPTLRKLFAHFYHELSDRHTDDEVRTIVSRAIDDEIIPAEAVREAMEEITTPPCERPVPQHMQHLHPRYPSGSCVVCHADSHEGCKHENYAAWEKEQTSG